MDLGQNCMNTKETVLDLQTCLNKCWTLCARHVMGNYWNVIRKDSSNKFKPGFQETPRMNQHQTRRLRSEMGLQKAMAESSCKVGSPEEVVAAWRLRPRRRQSRQHRNTHTQQGRESQKLQDESVVSSCSFRGHGWRDVWRVSRLRYGHITRL